MTRFGSSTETSLLTSLGGTRRLIGCGGGGGEKADWRGAIGLRLSSARRSFALWGVGVAPGLKTECEVEEEAGKPTRPEHEAAVF